MALLVPAFAGDHVISKIRGGQNSVSMLLTPSAWTKGIDAHAVNPLTRKFVLVDTPSCTTQWRKLQTDQSVKPSSNVTISFKNVSSSVLHLWVTKMMLPKILNLPWPPPSCILLVNLYLICTTSVLSFVAVVTTVLTSRIHGPMLVPSAISVCTMCIMPKIAPNAKNTTRRSGWMQRAGHSSVRFLTTSGSGVSWYSTRDEMSRVENCSVLMTRLTRRKMRSG